MKAMILAAGYGTRLKPLTDKKPKALVEINNTPMIELVIKKLIACGVREIVINLHHLPEQIVAFLEKNNNFGVTIHFSHESEILGTGGGLLQARRFLKNTEPFILHNVDIMSSIDISAMLRHHQKNRAIATLALMRRDSSRYFIVDKENFICGHENILKNILRMRRNPDGETRQMAFCGIHIISPDIFELMERSPHFSIVDNYLEIIENGLPIVEFQADGFYWKDIGRQSALDEIHVDLKNEIIRIDDLIRWSLLRKTNSFSR